MKNTNLLFHRPETSYRQRYRKKFSCIKKAIKRDAQIGKHGPRGSARQATLAKVRRGATDRTASLRRAEKHPREPERGRKRTGEKGRADLNGDGR